MAQITGPEKAFRILKCLPGASTDQVGRRYKEIQKQYQEALYAASELPAQYGWLMSKYPELLSLIGPKAHEIPTEYLGLLTNKLREIDEAHEILCKGKAVQEPMGADLLSEKGLLSFFGEFQLEKFYFASPNIPELKLNNAVAKSQVPATDPVFALFDCTVFGKA